MHADARAGGDGGADSGGRGDGGGDSSGRCEFEMETPGAFAALQFENPANPDFHEQTTAVEIWEQMEGRVDAWVSGVGSAGTFTGVARFLKKKRRGYL